MTRYLSEATTVLSNLSLANQLRVSGLSDLGVAAVSGLTVGSIATVGNLSVTTGASNTVGSGASVQAGCIFITVGASGLSLGIESGGSLYFINSTVSAD